LDNEFNFYNSEYEFIPIDTGNFTQNDLDFYEAKQHELESLGFKTIGDFEGVHFLRNFSGARYFCRLFLNDTKNIVAVVSQNKLSHKLRFVKNDYRQVTFRTEFSDGTFFETNNMFGINLLNDVDGIVSNKLNPNEPLEKMLTTHVIEINKISATKNTDAITLQNVDEIIESDKRSFNIARNYRKQNKGLTENEIKQILQNNKQQQAEFITKTFINEYKKQKQKRKF
jgi:hypothetical protein